MTVIERSTPSPTQLTLFAVEPTRRTDRLPQRRSPRRAAAQLAGGLPGQAVPAEEPLSEVARVFLADVHLSDWSTRRVQALLAPIPGVEPEDVDVLGAEVAAARSYDDRSGQGLAAARGWWEVQVAPRVLRSGRAFADAARGVGPTHSRAWTRACAAAQRDGRDQADADDLAEILAVENRTARPSAACLSTAAAVAAAMAQDLHPIPLGDHDVADPAGSAEDAALAHLAGDPGPEDRLYAALGQLEPEVAEALWRWAEAGGGKMPAEVREAIESVRALLSAS